MTKAVPPKRLPLKTCDGNQEDTHASEPSGRPSKLHFPLQQQQSPDWDEDDQRLATRGASRPTSLEELLDLELDLVLPSTAVPGPRSNQLSAYAAREELETDAVSLELLAMQSPHGENQQWQSEEEQDMVSATSTAPIQPEMQSPQRKTKSPPATRKTMPLSLVSPTAFVPSFPPSPSQSSTDDDYGLASPMALPDTPSQSRSGIALAWDLEPTSPTYEDTRARRGISRRLAQSKSVQRPERRASVSVAARAATPNPRSYRNCAPDRATPRITRSSLPTLPEVRGKARHGGIYSLLLKNKSMKQEAVLVDDARNPEEVTAATSISKVSPPRTLGKQTHGGIYKILRTSSHAPR